MAEFIGARISLISNSDIRYVGTLHEINSETSTVALENVSMLGTEGRRPGKEVAPLDSVYEYILFRGTDVKDLRIEEAPAAKENKTPRVPYDPAILGSGTRPTTQARPPLQFHSISSQGQTRQSQVPSEVTSNILQPGAAYGHGPQFPQFYHPTGWDRSTPSGPGGYPAIPYGGPPGWYPGLQQGFPPGSQFAPYGFTTSPPGLITPQNNLPTSKPIPIGTASGVNKQPVPIQQPKKLTDSKLTDSKSLPKDAETSVAPIQKAPTPIVASKPSPGEVKAAVSHSSLQNKSSIEASLSTQHKSVTEATSSTHDKILPEASSTQDKTSTEASSTQDKPSIKASSSTQDKTPIQASLIDSKKSIPTGPKTANRIKPAIPLTNISANKEPLQSSSEPVPIEKSGDLPPAIKEATQDISATAAAIVSKSPPSNFDHTTVEKESNGQGTASNKSKAPSFNTERSSRSNQRVNGLKNGSRGTSFKVDVPKEDFDFESANAKFSKKELIKEAISVSPVDEGASHDPPTDFEPPVIYNKATSFFDNISSEVKDRQEAGNSGSTSREWRGEERKKNLETFGQESIDSSYRGGYRGRGRGRGSGRSRGGFRGRGYSRNGQSRGRAGYQGRGDAQIVY